MGHLVVNLGRTGELIKKAEDAEESYIAAETLIGFSALGVAPRDLYHMAFWGLAKDEGRHQRYWKHGIDRTWHCS